MPIAIHNVAALMCLLLSGATALAAAAPTPAGGTAAELPAPIDLLAHGSDEMFWIVQVSEQPENDEPAVTSTVRARADAEPRWRRVARIAARVTDVANRGSDLIVLFEDGSWRFIWPGGSATGPRLPDEGRIRKIASEHEAIWAIGSVPGGMDAPPQSNGDEQAEPSGSPQRRLVVFYLDRSIWIARAELPEELQDSPDRALALAVFERLPMLSARRGDGSIQTWRLSEEEQWIDLGVVKPPFSAAAFKLIGGAERPLLWVADETGPGLIYRRGREWAEAVELQAIADFTDIEHRAIAVAFERLRLLFMRDQRLYEQIYNFDGTAVGEPTELIAPRPAPDPGVSNWINLAIMAALMFVILSAFRRRRNLQEVMQQADRLALAPLGVRLMAGLLDALPVIVAVVYMAHRISGLDEEMTAQMIQPANLWPIWLAVAVYLLHTCIIELIAGRSIGKIVFGLRVVALDGQPARPSAILVRNLLRVIDLWMFFPLLLVLVSPLRQRVGDIAAGTMVVSQDAGGKPPEEMAESNTGRDSSEDQS